MREVENTPEAAPAPSENPVGDAVQAVQESAQNHDLENPGVRDGDTDVWQRIMREGNMADPKSVGEEPEKPAEGPAAAEAPETPKDEKPAVDVASMDDEQLVAYEKAMRTARRAKTPQATIDAMSPDQLIAWADELSPVFDAADTAFDQVKRYEQQLEEGAEDDDGGMSPLVDSDDSTDDYEPVTLAPEVFAPFAEKLGFVDDPEAVGVLAEMGNAVAASVHEVFRAELRELQSAQSPDYEALQGSLQAMALRMARDDLAETHPSVKTDPELFNRVVSKYQTLIKTGDYGDHLTAMQDAAALLGVEKAGAVQPKPEPSKPPKEAQPTVTSKRVASPPPTREEADLAIFQHLQANPGDILGARRAAGL